jgi:hypothetical protein
VGWYGRDVIAFIFLDKTAAHCLPERSDKIKRSILITYALRGNSRLTRRKGYSQGILSKPEIMTMLSRNAKLRAEVERSNATILAQPLLSPITFY